MVKFDGNGQGYFDFIVQKCTTEFAARIEKQINDFGFEILNVEHEKSDLWGFDTFNTTVYFSNDSGSLLVCVEQNIVGRSVYYDTFELPYYMVNKFKDLGVL